jgi:trypsin
MCAVALMFGPSRADTSTVKRFLPTAVAALALLAGASPASAAPVAGKSVVGGSKASVSQFPFVVSVITPRSLCTGSIVTATRVLTAAHCVSTAAGMSVRVGSDSSFRGGQRVGVETVTVHPGYRHLRGGGAVADIALLDLSEPVTATPAVLSTPETDQQMTVFRAPALAIGYGQSEVDVRKKRKVGVLRGALQFSRPKLCARASLPLAETICTVGERYGTAKTRRKSRAMRRSACHGDSGGPLIGYSPQGPQVIGVASTVGGKRPRGFEWVGCGLAGMGTNYIRVSAYLDFINGSQTGG